MAGLYALAAGSLGGVSVLTKQLAVAAAVIRGADGRILLAKRADHLHQGGLWEFPGGKLEAGETPRQALDRELKEELGIEVTSARPLLEVRHHYPEHSVLLHVFEVSAFNGQPHGAEGQPLAWVTPAQLVDYEFPAANGPIVQAARLPDQYLITPDDLSPDELYAGIRRALARGVGLIQLRAPNMYDPQYRELAADVQGLCAGRAQLMLKGPLEWLGDFTAAGWHLTTKQLRDYAKAGRPFPKQRWLAASCHNAEELALAEQMGVDFVTLSPLQTTATHPEAEPLGWQVAETLLRGFNHPVFLLGGLTPQDKSRAHVIGAQGVAGIRAFWE